MSICGEQPSNSPDQESRNLLEVVPGVGVGKEQNSGPHACRPREQKAATLPVFATTTARSYQVAYTGPCSSVAFNTCVGSTLTPTLTRGRPCGAALLSPDAIASHKKRVEARYRRECGQRVPATKCVWQDS